MGGTLFNPPEGAPTRVFGQEPAGSGARGAHAARGAGGGGQLLLSTGAELRNNLGMAKRKNAVAVALGRLGGLKGAWRERRERSG
jgi:hypothetical protein